MSTYVTLAVFDAYLKVDKSVDVGDSALRQAAVDAAEAWINVWTGRQFVVAAGSSTRSYPASGRALLDIDDATTITAITYNGVTVDPSGYQLEPYNTVGVLGVIEPFYSIRRYFGWWDTFNQGQQIVSVTGTFGWVAIPVQVVEACKILARDLLANRDIPFGIASFVQYGMKVKENPTVTGLLRPFRRARAFGIG